MGSSACCPRKGQRCLLSGEGWHVGRRSAGSRPLLPPLIRRLVIALGYKIAFCFRPRPGSLALSAEIAHLNALVLSKRTHRAPQDLREGATERDGCRGGCYPPQRGCCSLSMGRTMSPRLRVTSLHHSSCGDQAGCPAWC